VPEDRKWAIAMPVFALSDDSSDGQGDDDVQELTTVAVTIDGDVALPGELSEHVKKMCDIVEDSSMFQIYKPEANV
jgi:NTE family protein